MLLISFNLKMNSVKKDICSDNVRLLNEEKMIAYSMKMCICNNFMQEASSVMNKNIDETLDTLYVAKLLCNQS